ncbi:hypothetical protein PZ61_0236095 [Streptomyces sp. MNU77]|nr:hypothetical protein PZ61_0236095 [Streptomyces sp. MNU77]
MRAYRIPAAGARAQWAETPVRRPGSGEILLRTAAAGVCRTDLEIIDHGVQFAPFTHPYTIGHENVGYVAELGAGVEDLAIGDAVVVNAGGTCGLCSYCRSGDDNYCSARPVYYGTRDDGGLAPYLTVRRRDVVGIGGLDPRLAAPLGDAGATAYGLVNAVRPYITDNGHVVVIGIGGLGSFALQLLRLLSSARVIAVDVAGKLEHARRRGAHETVVSGPDAAAEIMRLTGGRGADAVLDFVGIDPTLALGAKVARPLGCVGVVGTGGGSTPFGFFGPRPGVRMFTHASCTLRELEELVELTERGLLEIDAEFFPFAEAEHAYDLLRAGKITGRAVLTFDGARPTA